MKHVLFSENMKVSDLIHINYKLLFVLPRFDINLGLGESTVKQLCNQKQISVQLFLLVCNVYTYDDYNPDSNDVAGIPINELMIYLESSHKDYLNNRIPQILSDISCLASSTSLVDTLKQFCTDYEKEAKAHFEFEERIVFPYIKTLLQGFKNKGFTIDKFEKNHSNIEEKLNDLKSIIIKYLPQENSKKSREIIVKLFLLEEDLKQHALLEDKILVSLVENIENKLK